MGAKTPIAIAVSLLTSAAAWSMPIKSEMIKPRAYFQEADNNLLEALDLKAKTLTFGKKESEVCGTQLVRRAQTLTYSCTLPIPSKAGISKLQKLETAENQEIQFGGSKRQVQVQVNPDGKSVTFLTTFDRTGIDFEISKFNDDFFAVYAKVAHLILTDAMKKAVRFQILESR
jgi:hypothetical protein